MMACAENALPKAARAGFLDWQLAQRSSSPFTLAASVHDSHTGLLGNAVRQFVKDGLCQGGVRNFYIVALHLHRFQQLRQW